MKKTIAIDLDETLNILMPEWLKRYNQDYGDALQMSDMKTWDTYKFVKPECGMKIYDYVKDPTLFRNLDIQPDAQEVTQWLSQHYELFIVTAYNYQTCSAKVEWLLEHFPHIPENNIIFCTPKFLINADFLIDDGPHNITAFKNKGILVDAPWNQHLGNEFTRVHSWKQIHEFFKSLP